MIMEKKQAKPRTKRKESLSNKLYRYAYMTESHLNRIKSDPSTLAMDKIAIALIEGCLEGKYQSIDMLIKQLDTLKIDYNLEDLSEYQIEDELRRLDKVLTKGKTRNHQDQRVYKSEIINDIEDYLEALDMDDINELEETGIFDTEEEEDEQEY